MEKSSTTRIYLPSNWGNTSSIDVFQQRSSSLTHTSRYNNLMTDVDKKPRISGGVNESVVDLKMHISSPLDCVAQWFLSKSSMTNKKLQKLCYYAYCWFIVFFNDVETITEENVSDIRVLCSEHFQAWIHGPVSPQLYHQYKEYGWRDIPLIIDRPRVPATLESLLEQVWDAYGAFTADELESISHEEMPWKNARKGYKSGEACSNEISEYDVLRYYSSLG